MNPSYASIVVAILLFALSNFNYLCLKYCIHEFLKTQFFIMGWFSDDSPQVDNYNTWQNSEPKEHEASFAHELIAGAASYEAAKAYENHVAQNGQPPSHEKAKEIMAGFAGAFIDREIETKGLDFIDAEKAKYQARQHIDGVPADQVGY